MSASAAELVGDAYRQGISDGHGLNRAAGVAEEFAEARTIDQEMEEAQLVVVALLGAMPPALQRKWPNIVARAERIAKARGSR